MFARRQVSQSRESHYLLAVGGRIIAFTALICAASCAIGDGNAEVTPTTQRLLFDAIERSNHIRRLTFLRPCFECRSSSFKPAELAQYVIPSELDATESAQLRDLLSNPNSFISVLSKPCATFFPTAALRLESPNESHTVLLIYRECKTARLLTPDGEPHEFLNIDPISAELDKLLQMPGGTR